MLMGSTPFLSTVKPLVLVRIVIFLECKNSSENYLLKKIKIYRTLDYRYKNRFLKKFLEPLFSN